MPLTTRRYRTTRTARPVTTTHAPRARRGLFGRRRARAVPVQTHTVHHHHHHVHTQKRRPTMKDKISGAMLKLKGSLTHRPAVKAAGTRRMHGTDGRGSRHHRRY